VVRFLSLALLSLFFSAAVAHAASYVVRCVQQGLLDAGFDPNGVDGSLGRGTIIGSEKYQEAKGGGKALPPLSADTARHWCIALTDSVPESPRAEAVAACQFPTELNFEELSQG
jgi:hypothetical protein